MTAGREGALLLFIVTGYLGFTFLYSVVQTAWVNAGLERVSGTLETLFLTPANRLALVIGNSLMGLLESVWMFFVFAAVVIVAQAGGHASALALLVSFAGLLVEGADLAGVARGIALALGATALLVAAAVVVLRVGERRAKRTGSLILF